MRLDKLIDPLRFKEICWPSRPYVDFQGHEQPGVTFYDKQLDVIYSVEEHDETVVPSANMMGKDFQAAFIAVKQVVCNKVARIVTTSVKDDHLRVLWGEIMRFVNTSRVPLRVEDGGPLIINHRDIRKVVQGKVCDISYLRGMVSERGEGMAGHHAPYTLGIIDEASGVDDVVYTQMDTWARRKLIFGNCNPCANFFYRMVEEGTVKAGQRNRKLDVVEI